MITVLHYPRYVTCCQFVTISSIKRTFDFKMEDEKLIEMVRKYEFIYNLKHPKYMDNNKKEVAWKDIGEQVGESAVACKKRWQCLRDGYRRALNKRKGLCEKAAKNIKPWKYENEMAFVAPFILEKRKKDYVEITSEDESSDNSDDNNATENSGSDQTKNEIEDNETPVDISDATSADEVAQNETKETNYIKKRKPLKRKAAKPKTAELKPKSQDEQKTDSSRGHDELDRFFLTISDTVKKLSPYAQAVAKNKIFCLVSEMELQHLAPPNSSFVFNPASIGSTPTSSDNWSEQIQLFQKTAKRIKKSSHH